MGTGYFPGVKQPGRGADHPPSSKAEVKKEYGYTSTPPLGLHGMLWEHLYLYLYPFSNSVSSWLLTVQFLSTYTFSDVALYQIQINQPRRSKNLKYLYISLFIFSCKAKLQAQRRSQVISES